MFENRWKVANPGVKYKKNSIYEMQDIKLIKKEDIQEGIRSDRYPELVDANFVGKLAIVYEQDNIGRSGGNAQWCYVYDCNHGELTYRGTAIHKCVDADSMDLNYNEKLFSILGGLIFDSNTVRVPNIDLVKNLEWPEDKPAVLSYNVAQREDVFGQDIEEMSVMKTIAFNKMERQNIRDNRIPLNTILEAVKIQVMKKVGYEKKKAKGKVDDKITALQELRQSDASNAEIYNEQEKLLSVIKDKIDMIDKETTLNSFLRELTTEMGREITSQEISGIGIEDTNIEQFLRDIKRFSIQKEQNYHELEKSIIQTTVIDLMTNNVDRHLTNWALIRNKKTDRYVLGIFDHATSFFNMSLKQDSRAISQDYLKANWAPSSVLLDLPNDIKNLSSRGIDVFKYLMNNYSDYTLEILQKLHDKLPEFEKAIRYDTIPNAEYEKLSADEAKNYYHSESDMVVLPKKVIDGLKTKFKRIKKDYQIDFQEQKVYQEN